MALNKFKNCLKIKCKMLSQTTDLVLWTDSDIPPLDRSCSFALNAITNEFPSTSVKIQYVVVQLVFTVQAGPPLCGPPIPSEPFAGPFSPKSRTNRGNTSSRLCYFSVTHLVNVCRLMLSLPKGLQSCTFVVVLSQLI